MCASVSALLTSVGRRRTPCSKGSGGVNVGSAGPPLRWLTSADSWPATYPVGHGRSTRCARAAREHARSSIAAASASALAGRRLADGDDHIVAPSACAASTAPSSTRCGTSWQQRAVLRARRLALGGVDDDDRRGRARAATARSFVAVGKPAPPCPRRPARSSASISAGVSRRRRRGAVRAGARRAIARCSSSVSAAPLASAPRSSRGSAPACSRDRASRSSTGAVVGSRFLIGAGPRSHASRARCARAACSAFPSDAPIQLPSGPPGSHSSEKQREHAGAAERRAARARVLRPAGDDAHEHRREHDQQAGDAEQQAATSILTSLPVPKPCSSAIGQLA